MMKGLILKDLYILRGYGKQYGLIFLFLFAWSIMIHSFSFMTVYVILIGSSLVMTTMSHDESVSFNRFALTTPVSMRTIVKSKYLLYVITVGGGVLFSVLLNLLMYLSPFGAGNSFSWEGYVGSVTVFMIANAITFPCMFKLGVEKARYIYIFTMLLIGGVVLGAASMGEMLGISLESVAKIMDSVFSLFCLPVVGGVMLISYFISVRIVKNKGV